MAKPDLTMYLAKPNETLLEHTMAVEARADELLRLGLVPKNIHSILIIVCHYHDYGKVNPEFQKRIKFGGKFNELREIGHNILSIYFLDENNFSSEEEYLIVVNAILNHHHYVNNINELNSIVTDPDHKEKGAILEKLLNGFDINEFDFQYMEDLPEIRSNPTAILVQGLLHKCDYSASAHLPIEIVNDFLCDSLDDMMNRWQKNNPESNWNSLQNFCREHSDENIVAIAQTGMGKTEGGLWWLGNNKGFYILPLKTAINAIYERICREVLHGDSLDKVTLLHSDNVSYWLSRDNSPGGGEGEWDIGEYQTKTRQLSLPLTVATPDQLFDFVFKYPGYELKQATLSYSKVIIDEIQAYDAQLLAYIVRGLEVINEMGGKFAILTATLPPYIRDRLGINTTFVEGKFVNDIKRHSLKVCPEKLKAQVVAAFYRSNQEKGISNKILVICNTVKKAQEVFDYLKAEELEDAYLFHAKFIKNDRAGKERAILADGRTYDEFGEFNSKSVIWVATQVVEASLDIDFDYLFTELSDLNSLFQRLGRCNRKGKKPVDTYNCFVFTEIEKGILTNKDGTRGFIDRGLHDISKAALQDVDGVITEREKLELIETHLTTENLVKANSLIVKDFKHHYDYIKELFIGETDADDVDYRFRNIISYDVIPKSVYLENRRVIDEAVVSLSEKISYRKRIELQNLIKGFTVSVGYYDIKIGGKNSVVCRELGKNGKIKIDRHTEISIIDCHYDSETGFVRLNKDEINAGNRGKSQEPEETFDSFI